MKVFDIISTVVSYFSGPRGSKRKGKSTKSPSKRRAVEGGFLPVASNESQVSSIEKLIMDTTSSRLESEYEKVFYEYAREGNKLDEPKLREITNGIYDLPENSINSILESFNQLILIRELLIENEYVTPVISIVAMLSTLKVFKIYEKQITTPCNLPIDEYCKLIEKMITLRAIHTSNSGDLQIYQVDFEEKKKVMLQYIIKFKKMIENKRVTSIADQNDSNNYNSLIYRISKTIKIEKLREINTEDEIQAMIKKIFSDLSESDIETIKKMKTSIKCRDFGSGNNELDKLTNFLTYIENILTKNIKSSKDCYESVDKKYCRNIYDIIDKMFDPICKDNKKVNEKLSKEERNISTYNNELNRLYLNMGDEKPSKITELENKKRICMESKKKIEDNISNTKDKLNQILSSFEQYRDILKNISYQSKTSLRKKLDVLKGVGRYNDEYEKLVQLLL